MFSKVIHPLHHLKPRVLIISCKQKFSSWECTTRWYPVELRKQWHLWKTIKLLHVAILDSNKSWWKSQRRCSFCWLGSFKRKQYYFGRRKSFKTTFFRCSRGTQAWTETLDRAPSKFLLFYQSFDLTLILFFFYNSMWIFLLGTKEDTTKILWASGSRK